MNFIRFPKGSVTEQITSQDGTDYYREGELGVGGQVQRFTFHCKLFSLPFVFLPMAK